MLKRRRKKTVFEGSPLERVRRDSAARPAQGGKPKCPAAMRDRIFEKNHSAASCAGERVSCCIDSATSSPRTRLCGPKAFRSMTFK